MESKSIALPWPLHFVSPGSINNKLSPLLSLTVSSRCALIHERDGLWQISNKRADAPNHSPFSAKSSLS